MTHKRNAPFFAAMHRIAALPLSAWLSARTLHHVDKLIFKVSGGRTTLTSLVAGLPVVMVTTIGAKSGQPRTVPLLCIRDRENPTTFALIASNWGQHHYPAWYFNLKANPQATCSIAGRTGSYSAHEAMDEEYDRFWRYAANTYLGYLLYRERVGERRIPIMIMTPLTSSHAP